MSGATAARRSTVLLASSGLLFAAYGLPLLWPPAAVPLASPEPGATLLQRLFPSVPAWWVVCRLSCLAAAAALATVSIRDVEIPWRDHDSTRPAGTRTLNVAFALAVLLGVAAIRAPSFSRLGEGLFVLSLLLPPSIVAWSQRRHGAGRPLLAAIVTPLGLLLAWLAMRLPAALHSPRCADPIDMWTNFTWLLEAGRDGRNLLSHSSQPGLSDAWMLLQGIALLPPGSTIDFTWVQALHFIWLVLTAIAVWDATAMLLGRQAALVATAVLLFSPFFLSLPYNAAPFGVMTFLAAAMVALLARVHLQRSAAAAIALGVVLGFAATLPHLIPLGSFVAMTAVLLALRRPRLPWQACAAALLLGVAIVMPSLPDTATVRQMMARYVERNSEWQGLEAVLLGQRSINEVARLYRAGAAGALDVPLGALLAPFAIPRTSLRLWGDSLLDPAGASLLAFGLTVCFWRCRHDRRAVFALALVAVSIAPGLVSGYNRTSLHRMVAGPVVWSMLAAIGYAALQRTAARCIGALPLAAGVAIGGTLLFDFINPRIVPASWLAIALQANAGLAAGGSVVFLDYGRPAHQPWLHVETIARELPPQPIASRLLAEASDLENIAAAGFTTFYWSPALEKDFDVSAAVCGRWPGAVWYELRDVAGISGALAAAIDDAAASPSLPPQRRTAHRCNQASDSSDSSDLSDLSDSG